MKVRRRVKLRWALQEKSLERDPTLPQLSNIQHDDDDCENDDDDDDHHHKDDMIIDDDDGVDEKPLSMEGHSSPLPINQELAKDLRKVFEVIMMKMMMISIMFMMMMMMMIY